MSSPLSGRRVLIVEDEIMVAWGMQDMLTQLGCAVVGPASRVDQALGMIEAETFDAVVLDINLNGEKSYPVADALAARSIPFVFATAYDVSRLPIEYSGSPVLQKPFERAKLGDTLGKLLAPGMAVTPGTKVDPLEWNAKRLRIATDAAGVGLWSWNVDTDAFAMDERSHRLWGVESGPVTFEDLSARIFPEDLDKVREVFTATRDISGAYEVDFRVLHGKDFRWVSARGMGDDQGIVGRIMFGVFLDMTERKQAEEAREMLANEMGHRVKNLFAIASALTSISARSTTTSKEMARDLGQRLTALNRAHDLVRPLGHEAKRPARLGDLLTVLLAPYADEEGRDSRIRIGAPDLLVGEAAITTLALIVHELATNASKYGALSTPSGTVDVSCVAGDDEVVITWSEAGGPPVADKRGAPGFGSQLAARSISDQLGGSIAFDWRTEGVIATLRMSKSRLEV